MKAGWKTTEFWFAVAVAATGVYFVGWGEQAEVGGLLLLASVPGYQVSRGMAKKAQP